MKGNIFKWNRDKIDAIIIDCGFLLNDEYGGIYFIQYDNKEFTMYLYKSSICIKCSPRGIVSNKIYTYKELINQLNSLKIIKLNEVNKND